MLSNVDWRLVTDVVGQPVHPVTSRPSVIHDCCRRNR